jgi:hypothetical protein
MSVAGSANADVPIGVVFPYGGFIAPKGGWWLLCDGSVFDPVEYSALYSVIGTSFGGTAQAPLLPDMRGKYGLGYTAGVNSVGETVTNTISGNETFTLIASDIPTLGVLTPTPQFTFPLVSNVYNEAGVAEVSAITPYTIDVAEGQTINAYYLRTNTTLSGSNIEYSNPTPTPVAFPISASAVAYAGYDMTFIIKAKGF